MSRKNSKVDANLRETENQTFPYSEVYATLQQNREPDNTYASLNLYENQEGNSLPAFVSRNESIYMNQISTSASQEHKVQWPSSYVIPLPNIFHANNR